MYVGRQLSWSKADQDLFGWLRLACFTISSVKCLMFWPSTNLSMEVTMQASVRSNHMKITGARKRHFTCSFNRGDFDYVWYRTFSMDSNPDEV
jgi:hypothetical protein